MSTVDDRWYVQEAHVLPDGNTVIFYGNHTTEVGASGNGLQWWAIPASGGDPRLDARAGAYADLFTELSQSRY